MSNQNAESLDVSAKTVDEAIKVGLAQLNLSREQVDIEIISEGKRGVFGLGAEEAQVRLTPRLQVEEKSTQEAIPSLDEMAKSVDDEARTPERDLEPNEASDRPLLEAQKSVEEIAKRHLSELLSLMGIKKAKITARLATDLVERDEAPPLVLNVTGQDLGILIGRRSETLRALQYMLRLMVSKELASWQPIVVDVESYRVRRRRSLQRMAAKMAERAVASRKRVVLEAMPAYERRLIHVALKDHPAVITKSIGADDNRKVTIIPR
jgi:spoIIIJ-associated protein